MTATAPLRLRYPWLLGAGLAVGLAQAQPGEIQTGRYTVLAAVATAAQADPLQALIRLELSRARPLTVADALGRALQGSGYRLAAPDAADPLLAQLLTQPLPASQRRLGPMTLERTLKVLAGSAWRLVIDRLHRRVSFEAAAPYVSYHGTGIGPMTSMQRHPSAGLARGASCPHTLSVADEAALALLPEAADKEQEALRPMQPTSMDGASP